MKALVKIALAILALATLMYAEYRYIMVNQTVYTDGDTVYIEIFDSVDIYDAETWEE